MQSYSRIVRSDDSDTVPFKVEIDGKREEKENNLAYHIHKFRPILVRLITIFTFA